jgi:hypothetical protein
MPDGEAFLAI